MKNFATLYGYELRKQLGRKLVWALLAAFTALTLLISLSDVLTTNRREDGGKQSVYAMEAPARAASRAVSGTPLDNKTLQTAAASGFTAWYYSEQYTPERKAGWVVLEQYMHMLAYPGRDWPFGLAPAGGQAGGEAPADPYAVYEAWLATPESARLGDAFYADRRATAETSWQTYWLDEGEKAYWKRLEDTLPIPFIWQYAQGWQRALQSIQTLNIMALVLAAAGLAAVFSDETARRTDQLLLTGRYGRGPLYAAKWLAGATVTLGGCAFLTALCLGIAFALYGAEGAGGAIQLSMPFISRHLTFGTALAFYLALLAAAALLYSALTLFLSELLQNATAVLAAVAGPLLLAYFANIDPAPGITGSLSHILYLLPSKIVRSSSLGDPRLVPCALAPGGWLTNLQAGLVIYPLFTALLALAGYRLWRRHQVTGR